MMDELPAGYDQWLESPYTGPEADVEGDEEPYSCGHAGRHGCGHCDACEMWADAEYDSLKDEGYYD